MRDDYGQPRWVGRTERDPSTASLTLALPTHGYPAGRYEISVFDVTHEGTLVATYAVIIRTPPAADDARVRMNRANTAARQAGSAATSSGSYAAALAAEREGERLCQSGHVAEAAFAPHRLLRLDDDAKESRPNLDAHSAPLANTTLPPTPASLQSRLPQRTGTRF